MKRTVIGLICLAFFAGCGGSLSNVRQEKTARQLADAGMMEFKKENYKKAAAAFENLRNWYPFSEFAELAELKIADAYFMEEAYPEAIAEYESFRELHPRNRAIPHVLYRIGLSYYNQVKTIDRDQDSTRLAIEVFQTLNRQFPRHRYRNVNQYIRKCRSDLAENMFYVGLQYFKAKHYQAAIKRFQQVLDQYADSKGTLGKARHYLNLSKNMAMKIQVEAEKKKREKISESSDS